MITKAAITLCAVGFLIAGCRSKQRTDQFGAVQSVVKDRIDKDVRWNRGTAEDKAVNDALRQKLAGELNADEAVQIALLNNRHLQATYEDLGIAQADLVQAGMLKNPLFHGNIGFIEAGGFKTASSSSSSAASLRERLGVRGNPPTIPPPPGGTAAGSDSNITGEVGFVFFFMDLLLEPLRKRIAEEELLEVKARVTQDVLNMAAATRSAFYHVQAAQQLVEMQRSLNAAHEASADIARRLNKAGNLTDLQLLEEEAQYARAKLELAAAEMHLTERREAINRLMGLWGQDIAWKASPGLPEIPAQEIPLEHLESQAVAKSLDLESMRRHIQSAGHRLGMAGVTGLVPDIEIGVSARNISNQWITGPMFEIPLPVFDQGQGKKALAAAELRRARQEYVAVAVDLRSEVREAQARLVSARDRAVYYQSVMLPLQRRIVEEAQKNYNAMLKSPLDLLGAKQRELDSVRQYLESLVDYWMARTELEQLLNGARPERRRMPAMEHSESVFENSGGGH